MKYEVTDQDRPAELSIVFLTKITTRKTSTMPILAANYMLIFINATVVLQDERLKILKNS